MGDLRRESREGSFLTRNSWERGGGRVVGGEGARKLGIRPLFLLFPDNREWSRVQVSCELSAVRQ